MGIDSGREKLPIEHGTILDRLDRVDVSALLPLSKGLAQPRHTTAKKKFSQT